MGVLSAIAVSEIKARGSIKDADVARLRRNFEDDGQITAEEADAILALNKACPIQDPAWASCFIETLTDYIVNQAGPEGYLTAENARWLRQRIARDGRVETTTELELLLNVLKTARWIPQGLVRFALTQVQMAVLDGDGPLRLGRAEKAGIVSQADVDLLRRITCSFGADGNLAITQPEADELFEIDGATAWAANHPSWGDFFVKALVSCVMAASGYATPSRKVALTREPWIGRAGDLSWGAIPFGVTSARRNALRAYRPQTEEERAIARLARQKLEIVTHEPVLVAEPGWLAARIGREGRLTPNERTLLRFLKAEAPAVHPVLRELVERVSAAA